MHLTHLTFSIFSSSFIITELSASRKARVNSSHRAIS